jgi:tripartite-type tricarboxylate transporter receptor subunit TctC
MNGTALRRLCVLAAFATAHLSEVSPVRADDWPNRPVRIINTFAVGGAADLISRLTAEHLSNVFKQQFFVETRTGASGTIGVQSVVTAPPDGYNFVMTTSTLLVLLPASNPNLGYHPKRDLTNIAYIAGTPIVLSIGPKSDVNTLKDFIALAKKSPKPLSYSSSGVGSSGHLVAELLAKQAGIKIEHVPYRGGSQSLTDLLGGHIAFASQTLPSTSAQIKSGALTAFAHSGKERLVEFPNVPTLKEQGHDIVSTTWYSLSGPAGLPDHIAQKINREISAGMAKPEFRERLLQAGFLNEPMNVAQFHKFIDAETARWKPVIEAAGLVVTK